MLSPRKKRKTVHDVDNYGVQISFRQFTRLRKHAKTSLKQIFDYYMFSHEPDTSGKLAEVLATCSLQLQHKQNKFIIATLPSLLPSQLCKAVLGAAPYSDVHGTDIVLLIFDKSTGHIRIKTRIQCKHHCSSKLLHYDVIGSGVTGLLRLLYEHDVHDQAHAARLLGDEYMFITANKISAAPSKTAINIADGVLKKFSNTNISVTTNTFEWDEMVQYMKNMPTDDDNIVQQHQLAIDTREQLREKSGQVVYSMVMHGTPIHIAIDAKFPVIEKVAYHFNIATGVGKTRLAFYLCQAALYMHSKKTGKIMACLIVTGSINVDQYLAEAAKEGIRRENIQVISDRSTTVDTTKPFVLLSLHSCNTASFKHLQKHFLMCVVDEAHKMHTAGSTNGTGIGNKNLSRNQLIGIISMHCLHVAMLTGTPLHKLPFNAKKMVTMTNYDASKAGISQIPDICIITTSDDIDTRHAQVLHLILKRPSVFVVGNCILRFLSVAYAQRFCDNLYVNHIPFFQYFGQSLQMCKNRSLLLPTKEKHGLIICVDALDGNVNIPGAMLYIAVDRIEPKYIFAFQQPMRLSRPDTPYSTIIMLHHRNESLDVYVNPFIAAMAVRTGIPLNKICTTVWQHDMDMTNVRGLQLFNDDNDDFLFGDEIVTSSSKSSSSAKRTPIIIDDLQEIDNDQAIDPMSIDNRISLEKCVEQIMIIKNMCDDEIDAHEAAEIAAKKLAKIEKKQEAKEDKQTQQLSDLEQLEICAKNKNMPSHSKPEERRLAQKWNDIRRGKNASKHKLIMAENTKYRCLKILLIQHDAKPKKVTPVNNFKVDISALEEALGKVVVSPAYKAHSDLNNGKRVRGLLGYLCNNKNAYPKQKHTKYGRYAKNLKHSSTTCKADRIYINAFKAHLPESVRTALKMDRWNDKGTWL